MFWWAGREDELLRVVGASNEIRIDVKTQSVRTRRIVMASHYGVHEPRVKAAGMCEVPAKASASRRWT